jgi:hypothetical protein
MLWTGRRFVFEQLAARVRSSGAADPAMEKLSGPNALFSSVHWSGIAETAGGIVPVGSIALAVCDVIEVRKIRTAKRRDWRDPLRAPENRF